MTIAKNQETAKFTRSNRFLIDDPDSPIKLSYILSKPLKLGGSFNGKGVYKFVLQEVNSTDDDNRELGIADYYKYFPEQKGSSEEESSGTGSEGTGGVDGNATSDGRRVWL